MMFHNYFLIFCSGNTKCSSESENCSHPTFFQKVVIKGLEVQWQGRRMKMGHEEGRYFCSISLLKVQILPIFLTCFSLKKESILFIPLLSTLAKAF